MLKPKPDQDRQTDSGTEIELGKCADSHLPSCWHSERDNYEQGITRK